jgi:hypothetical protein
MNSTSIGGLKTLDPAPVFHLNGEPVVAGRYSQFHARRLRRTLEALCEIGAKRIVEVGGNPWWMTSQLVADPRFEVCATISAEEVTQWPEDIGVTRAPYTLVTDSGRRAEFTNYSVNIERTLVDLDESPDTVIACEIIEHLIRAPHVMLLNVNRWLSVGGKLLITTPNGEQFSNPFRAPRSAAYRYHVYGRHHFTFALEELTELVELCGFRVRRAEYWDVYDRTGPSAVYGWLARIPHRFFRRRFRRTLAVVAEKSSDVRTLPRAPRIYHPSPDWEHIAPLRTGEELTGSVSSSGQKTSVRGDTMARDFQPDCSAAVP